MLRACMIDGFGWFQEALYRRNWLLFDDVDYIFPIFVKSVSIPPRLLLHREFQVIQLDLGDELVRKMVEQALADAADESFRALISAVPRRDADYAGGIVYADDQVRSLGVLPNRPDPVFALSYLAQKLVACANSVGSVPIVGQDYAVRLLSHVVKREASNSTVATTSLVTDRQALNVHAIAAGLSLRFISDDMLGRTDIAHIESFKNRAAGLRELHHLELLKVAGAYDGFPIDSKFGERLAALRVDAEAVRKQLDFEGRDLWASLGLQLADKAAAAAAVTGAVVGGIAMIRADLSSAIAAAIPAGVYALSHVAQTLQNVNTKRRSYVSYLTDARDYLAT